MNLILKNLLANPKTKNDFAIFCKTKEEWDTVLEIHNPKDLDNFSWDMKGEAIYTDGAHSGMDFVKRMNYSWCTAEEFLAANQETYEIY